MRNALTVDVEDWFQVSNLEHVVRREEWDDYPSRVCDNTRRLLDLFDEKAVRATFFVLGWVAERFPDLVREIRERGHELGSHGHRHELVYRIGPVRFREDVLASLAAIESASGVRARGYRAPSFSIDRRSFWALDVLAECGLEYDSSIFPVRHPRYGVPSFPRSPRRVRTRQGAVLQEFPMTTWRVLGRNVGASGGGWLRILPASVMHRAFHAMNASGQPAVLYVHPWEIDPDQPRVRGAGLRAVTHRANLRGTLRRVAALLDGFAFAPMGEVLAAAPGRGEPPVELPA